MTYRANRVGRRAEKINRIFGTDDDAMDGQPLRGFTYALPPGRIANPTCYHCGFPIRPHKGSDVLCARCWEKP